MSLGAELDHWLQPDQWDHDPTLEEALRQLLYSAIDAYLRQQALITPRTDEIPGLSDWVDSYAESK